MLLSHLVATVSTYDKTSLEDQMDYKTFLELMPGPVENIQSPPLCVVSGRSLPSETIQQLYARFGNNNFTIHSHMLSIAHGIFPLASRLFNHSCVPNAAAKYILTPGRPPVMEIVALRDIAKDSEVSILPL